MSKKFSHRVTLDIPYLPMKHPIVVWLQENVGPMSELWTVSRFNGGHSESARNHVYFDFADSRHAVLFKLTWGGE